MAQLALKLAVNIEGAILFQSRKADEAFLRLQTKVWTRDNNTCQFCGFQAKQYQEVVNINGDYQQNELKNLATACVFCAHTQLIGFANNSRIIYLPDMTQVDLNNFARILFCSASVNEEFEETSKTLIQGLRQRAAMVERVFGMDCSDSRIFAQTFVDAADIKTHGATYSALFKELRWLPSRSDYDEIITYWTQTVWTREVLEQGIANDDH